jgi:putative hydrolase of the HAD superfamily
LLEVYGRIRVMLEAEAYRDLPDPHGMIDALARRVGRLVDESYARGELDELDIVEKYEEAYLAMGVDLPRERIHDLAVLEHRAFISPLVMPVENLEVLARLRELGLKLGLVSNAHFLPDLMHGDIKRLGIAQYLDDAVFSSEIRVRKPHPAIFQKVLAELHVDPSEAVFVGDRVKDDIGGAQSLGMRGVLTRQFRQEEFEGTGISPAGVIDRLSDLIPRVEGWLEADPTRSTPSPAQ